MILINIYIKLNCNLIIMTDLPTITEDDVVTVKNIKDDVKRLKRIKCKILPVMDNVNISIDENKTLKVFDFEFTKQTELYAKHIIFRGEILKDYTVTIKELKIRSVDEFFIVKREMSNTLIRSTSSQTRSFLRSFLNRNFTDLRDGSNFSSEITYNFELTDGENTYPISDTETSNSFTNALNELLNTTLSAPPPEPIDENSDESSLIPLPEYEYQSQLNQLLSMGYIDEIAIRAALEMTEGDVSASLIYL